MADPTKMTDAELQEAAAEMARRAAETTAAQKASFLETIAPLIDVGFGGTKKASISDILDALTATRALVPAEWFSALSAAEIGMRQLHEKAAFAKSDTPVVTPPPTPAAP